MIAMAMPVEFAVRLDGVGKRYGTHWVLSRLTLDVRKGESVALFGGNGSGKSTLLKIVATLLAPSTGTLSVLGFEVSKQKEEIRNRIRLLGHEKQLYGSLTVLENLKLAAGLRGLSSAETPRVLKDLLDKVQMTPFEHRRVGLLSEGMKKRVVIARLLIGLPEREPEMILLDEPHPSLDTEGREILDGLIRDWKRRGKTVLLASHDHDIALGHVDRLVVLDDGMVGYDGPPKRIE